MKKIWNSFKNGISYLKNGRSDALWESVKIRMYSKSLSIGLRRDIRVPFENPDANFPLSVRPFEERDIDKMLGGKDLMQLYPRIINQRKAMVQANLPVCYVAVTPDDIPCYMQWLIGSENNRDIQRFFGGKFPILKSDEALLEGAFSHPDFRGLKVMPAAMARIAARAMDIDGVRWVLTFVGMDNIPSLKGCHRAGFKPYTMRIDRTILGMSFTSFNSITDEVKNIYETVITPSKPAAA